MSELPSGWVEGHLGEVADFVMGQAPSASDCNTDGVGTVFVKAGEFRNIKPVVREWTTRPLKHAQDGDILICVVGATAGKINLGINCAIGRSVAAVRPSHEVSQKFIYYFLAGKVKSLRQGSTGSAQGVISKPDLAAIKIPMAPPAEQIRIAFKLDEVLAQVDTIKARIDRITTLLKRFRQSVLAAAVSGRLTKNTESSDLPSGWQLVKFSTVVSDLRYGTAQKCDYNGGEIGVLRIPNIGDNGIRLNDLKSSSFSPAEINKLSLKKGDILLIRSNGSVELVGKSAVVGAREEGLLFAGYLIRIRLNPEKAIAEYVNYWLKSPAVRQTIEMTARSTSGVNNINSEEIKSLIFTMPPPSEQIEIVNRVEQLFAMADQLEAKVTSAENRIDHLTQSILIKAFRGELVPQDPNDEPVGVLLDRIKAQRATAPKAKRGRQAITLG